MTNEWARKRKSGGWRASIVLAVAASGCTAVKPVACALVYPVQAMSAAVAKGVDEDDDDDYNDIPPVLVLASAPVLIPLSFLGLSITGAAAGLVSGFASDLNFVTGNVDWDELNLFDPYKTNARRPAEAP